MSPEPITTTAIVAAKTIASGEKTSGLIKRMLGPAADEIGIELAEWIKNRHTNVDAIIASAERKLGDEIETPGAIPLRVAAQILGEGSFCSDRVMGEYLGGVLASSRTPEGRDDRGARWVNLITSLSSYEIRLHYLFYAGAYALYKARGVLPEWGDVSSYDLGAVTACFETIQIAECMEFSESENAHAIVPESLFALGHENLITNWRMIPEPQFKEFGYISDAASITVFRPTPRGIQLFMWAQGFGNSWEEFADLQMDFSQIGIQLPSAITMDELRQSN